MTMHRKGQAYEGPEMICW